MICLSFSLLVCRNWGSWTHLQIPPSFDNDLGSRIVLAVLFLLTLCSLGLFPLCNMRRWSLLRGFTDIMLVKVSGTGINRYWFCITPFSILRTTNSQTSTSIVWDTTSVALQNKIFSASFFFYWQSLKENSWAKNIKWKHETHVVLEDTV